MQEQEQSRWDLLLLLSLLLVILMYPVLDNGELRRLFLGALVFVPAIAAIVKLSKIKMWIWPSALLMSVAFIFAVASVILSNRALAGIKWGFLSAFFGATVFGLFNYLKNARCIRNAQLLTAVSIYLLIGMQWFALYSAIDVFWPDSFLHNSPATADRQTDLLYFSLVTLSTLGYGDILPLHSEVRMLAALEAITGVLYIAITVALLVGAYSAGRPGVNSQAVERNGNEQKRKSKADGDKGRWISGMMGFAIAAALLSGCAKDDRDQIVRDAYIYGYPLVTMDMTRRQETNVSVPDDAHAPVGQLIKLRTYPAVDNHGAAAPNADTLYTMVWLDVSAEPWVFSIPDMGNRYYIMPMLSGFNEVFFVAGPRTTGYKAQTYAVTGPGWSGTLPEGVTQVKSPTALVWILGRVYCTGTPEDYQAVHEMQDRFSVVPLSSYGKSYTPPAGGVDEKFDMKTAVRKQVDAMPVDEFFAYFAQLLKTNSPKPQDAPIVARMSKIGIVPGQDLDRSKLPALGNKLNPKLALLEMLELIKAKKAVNGWLYWIQDAGTYGTDYAQRAMVTLIGPGLNFPQDAVYPFSEKDEHGDKYDGGSHRYLMHFGKGQMPPVQGFWSLTMYDPQFFFVPNPINRYNLSQRNTFVANPDGSVDLYLQSESPGPDKEANWLPAPKGNFVPMLRLYWPTVTPPSILDSSWKPPPITVAP